MVVCCRCVLHRLCSTTCIRPCIKPLGVLSRHPCRNPKPLPHGEGLCMLSWLCICAIVVVCCRCVLHRLCSTTCMRPCIEHLGIHARRPCRAECGAAALTKQGRLQSVAHSRYARKHKDSHTKPLHDATALCGCQCTDAVTPTTDDLHWGYAQSKDALVACQKL